MTKLPSKELLDGSKVPKTTTGEMKDALGKLRDYLDDLLGEDSFDKETARQKLGIDLMELTNRLDAKADRAELTHQIQTLKEEIAERGVPVGSIDWFATTTPPAGYLKADGSTVGRETYPDLFAAIGTCYGEGDGETTFNLPNLIGRFAEGSVTPGTVKEAGLPNITGDANHVSTDYSTAAWKANGAFYKNHELAGLGALATSGKYAIGLGLDASRSNPIYGRSDTVQPSALTLLPCIKAFDAAVNTGLVDMTALAQEVANKTDNISAVHAAMPSEQGVDLTLPASGKTIVAPADGWVVFVKVSGAAGEHIELNGEEVSSSCMAAAGGKWCKVFLPVPKNGNITAYYTATGETRRFRFIYANGSQP